MRFQDQSFQQREQSILDAAQQLFRQQAWDRLTIAELAVHAGIGKGTLYKHFSSKEALYAHLVLRFSQQRLAVLAELAASLQPAQRMLQVIRQSFASLQADPVMTQLWLHCDRPDFRQRLTEADRNQMLTHDQQLQQFFLGLLADTLGPLQLNEEDSIRLLWSLEASVLGVMARIAAGGFNACEEPFAVEDYFDHVSQFIIAGLHGQAMQLNQPSIKSNF